MEDVELLEEEHDAEDGEVLLVLAKAVEELDLLLDGLLRDLRERGAVLGLLDGLGEALLALLLGVALDQQLLHLEIAVGAEPVDGHPRAELPGDVVGLLVLHLTRRRGAEDLPLLARFDEALARHLLLLVVAAESHLDEHSFLVCA